MIEAASPASALHLRQSQSPLARSFGSFVHRRWPNPSVKGTATSGLRPLVAAPYLER
jgi:hypothetical protein